MSNTTNQIVFTNKAQCRDCYRCLRVCPVKAIRMQDGQAQVVAERCISCGTCIRHCPQKAKGFRNDVNRAVSLLNAGGPVAASVAPSFVAMFSPWQQKRLPSALRELGFAYVGETAVGAHPVAVRTAEVVNASPHRPHICTACPAVVSYIEQYEGDLAGLLTGVTSPMIAHARHIKNRLGRQAGVIFIGPCIAKKAEAQRPENAGLVDCVLTFEELMEWLAGAGIKLAACEESGFDEAPAGHSRVFALTGGCLKTGGLSTDVLSPQVLCVSGFEAVREAIGSARTGEPVVIEPLFCPDGCINGPALPGEDNVHIRRRRVLDYARDARDAGETPATLDLSARFAAMPAVASREHSEDDIRRVLEMTGKTAEADQLNCGACGYPSCRQKAVAVLDGMAEPQMCIPHMRRLAERRTDRIIETSPNGIVILDERLGILSMNPAFARYFMCTQALCGKHVSCLMDPHLFEKLATGQQTLIEQVVRHEKYGLLCHQILYSLPQERQYVGIFVNITRSQADKEKLSQLQAATTLQARELLEHQLGMAQKIAQFLGESAARGEQLVENLMELAGERIESAGDGQSPAGRATSAGVKGWKWDTSTPK